MKQKILAYIKSIPWSAWVLLFFIGLGIFLRVYHFQDWLFMKGDQARDAFVTMDSYKSGLLGLPLLGPRAGGTILRLGPIFYYFQYISAVLFHSTAAYVVAYPTLFFSILTIPVLYLFLKKFFSVSWSLLMTAMFSMSYILIDYSRYAWNPNAVPFFVILFFLSLLEIFSQTKHPIRWIITAAVSFSVATQLHFSVFVALPIILVVFSIFNFKNIKSVISWKQAVIFLSIVFIFYTPVILSDVLNNGDNLHQFISSVGDKSSDKSFQKNITKDAYYFGKGFLFMSSSYMGSNKALINFAQLLTFVSFLLNIFLWKKERDKRKANFLLIILLNFATYFLLYIPLASETDNSRFFLPLALIPFVFLGLIGYFLKEKIQRYNLGKILFGLFIGVIFLYDLRTVYLWFDTMTRSQNQYVTNETSIILDERGNKLWWTWSHFQKIAVFMHDDCQQNDIYFMMSKKVKDYGDSIQFAFQNSYTDKNVYLLAQDVPAAQGCFYFVAQSSDDFSKDIKENFAQDSITELGNVSILRFSFHSGTILAEPTQETGSAEVSIMDEEYVDANNFAEDDRMPRRYWADVYKFILKKLNK
jgi:hypothetical protein